MKFTVVAILISISLFGCAQQETLLKKTRFGYPEATFYGVSLSRVQAKLEAGCLAYGLTVYQMSSKEVICGKILSGFRALSARIAIDIFNSTTPQQKVRFILNSSGNEVHVSGKQWLEVQLPSGEIRVLSLNRNMHQNEIQKFLSSLGAD